MRALTLREPRRAVVRLDDRCAHAILNRGGRRSRSSRREPRIQILQRPVRGQVQCHHVDKRRAAPERDVLAPVKDKVRIRLACEKFPKAARDPVFSRSRQRRYAQPERRQRKPRWFRAQQDADGSSPSFGRAPHPELHQGAARQHGCGGNDVRRKARERAG